MVNLAEFRPSIPAQTRYLDMIEGLMVEKTAFLAMSPDISVTSAESLWRQSSDVLSFCWNLRRVKGSSSLHHSLLQQAIQFMSSHLIYLDQLPSSSLKTSQLQPNPLLLLHVSTP